MDQARLKAGKKLHLGNNKEKELQTFQKRYFAILCI